MSDYCLEVNRNHLNRTRIIDLPIQTTTDDEAVIKIEQFAITANNITYGVAGDIIGYWQFFPTGHEWGRIPVWGKGTVTDPGNTSLAKGDEYYGYFPMATYLVVKPIRIDQRGFTDGAAHRADLPAVYNQYSLMTPSNGFDRRYDKHRMAYFPLFMTGFVLDDFLYDNQFFGAENTLLSSASSKTAISMAFQLKKRGVCITGLTSIKNQDFVKSLGLYNSVINYDEITTLQTQEKTNFVDMAGNRQVLAKVHHHFQENLALSCGVGITHYESRESVELKSLPGAKPSMFFAPDQIKKRNRDWGSETLQAEIQSAWQAFLGSIDEWIHINESHDRDGLISAYETVLGGAAPDQVHVVSVR